MLVPNMNFDEIDLEVNTEYEILCNSSTLGRLTLEYMSLRRKNKIKPREKYPKWYNIKSKKKNNWLIMISPKDECECANDFEDFSTLCMIYFHSNQGLKFMVTSPSKVLTVYNAHLFHRYIERLQLNIPHTIDAAKHFFEQNHQNTFQSFPLEENKKSVIGIVKTGFTLGELFISEGKKIVLNYKTFISRDTANFKHAKSILEFEKIYNNTDDPDIKMIYEELGFDKENSNNDSFMGKWNFLREDIQNREEQNTFIRIVPEKE